LAALGLAGHVRDWDVTTDAPTAVVLAALRSTRLAFVPAATGNELYATQARFVVLGNEHEVDVLVGFAVRLGDRVVPLPTRSPVTGAACRSPTQRCGCARTN